VTLSVDQRWLLLHMGTWQIVHALCSPEGVSALMQSHWGSTTGRCADLPDAPEWLHRCGFETYGGTITARTQDCPPVRIKAAEINRYAAQLPADIKAGLIACRDAGAANAVLGYRLCRDKRKHTHLPMDRDKICPATVEQEAEQRAEYWRIVAWQHVVLAKALGLTGDSHVVGDQLELFGAAS
jgi:hypothetical protein